MKVLILRFSSIGDVLQCLSVAGALSQKEGAEVHWATREDLQDLVTSHPGVRRVFTIEKSTGLRGLWHLTRELRKQGYTHVYDAHNNLRSHLIVWFLLGPLNIWGRLKGVRLLRRPIPRLKRYFLFRWRWNLFEQPFSGQRDLLKPLVAWGLSPEAPQAPQLFVPQNLLLKLKKRIPFTHFIALAPSAAFELKRWPLDYWKQLIASLPEENFVILGGPEDGFLKSLKSAAPDRVVNLAGALRLTESAAVVQLSRLLIANDTGVLHMAEQLGKEAIALMGPAPFGFPSRPKTRIMELQLDCRPCSKHGQGPCVNESYHKCLADIRPSSVIVEVQKILASVAH